MNPKSLERIWVHPWCCKQDLSCQWQWWIPKYLLVARHHCHPQRFPGLCNSSWTWGGWNVPQLLKGLGFAWSEVCRSNSQEVSAGWVCSGDVCGVFFGTDDKCHCCLQELGSHQFHEASDGDGGQKQNSFLKVFCLHPDGGSRSLCIAPARAESLQRALTCIR